jgi:hypothetical protein
MNERIRELARKAQVGSAEFGNGINYFVSTEETFNKFAELIVKECADVATINQFQYDAAGNYVLKHFGVGE